jgi:SAM-dependent methyltransferase
MSRQEMPTHSPADLQNIYKARFSGQTEYRQQVWNVLCPFFSKWIPSDAAVLDLGCGYCEFINTIVARQKYAMDLNPEANRLASPGVRVLQQDCSAPWEIPPDTLDAVFTSNFFEHLPDKAALERTLHNARTALRSGGNLVMMGPNIKYVPGAYWDFFDHYIPLTELSLAEVLKKCGYEIEVCIDRFLPYTMSQGRTYPLWMLRVYLAMPWAWPFFGKQFLVVARRSV